MEKLKQEYESLLDRQHFDASELDYTVLDGHIRQLTLLSQVANCGITVYDMHRRCHVFASYNFPELFRYDLKGIATEDTDYFKRHIHPDDWMELHRNGIACLRFLLDNPALAPDVKLVNGYRVNVDGKWTAVIEQFQILEFDARGNIWLSLSMLDIAPEGEATPGVRSRLFNYRTGESLSIPRADMENPVLSAREREILGLIGQGKLSKEIAEELFISVHTVNTHRQRILEKLRVGNSMEAVRYARMYGLLDTP